MAFTLIVTTKRKNASPELEWGNCCVFLFRCTGGHLSNLAMWI